MMPVLCRKGEANANKSSNIVTDYNKVYYRVLVYIMCNTYLTTHTVLHTIPFLSLVPSPPRKVRVW